MDTRFLPPNQRNWPSPWLVAAPGVDLEMLSHAVSVAHAKFVDSGGGVGNGSQTEGRSGVRSVILESWKRSWSSGVHPEVFGSLALNVSELKHYRDKHPMAAIVPIIRKLLVEDAQHAGLLVALTDEKGRLLWVEGDSDALDKAEGMHFVEGADWSEARVGTNAPGTAIAVDECVQIFGSEHFSRSAHGWSCSAAPVHDPRTGKIIGVIDITGGPRVVAPEVLSLVRTTAAVAEAELRLRYVQQNLESGCGATLSVLGSGKPTFNENGFVQTLSLRHAEILVLLGENPQGLTADALAVLLDERELDAVTIRAEMSRLRRAIGEQWLSSRPYRLTKPLTSDLSGLRLALGDSDIAAKQNLYSVPLLNVSQSPGITVLRQELDAEVCAAMMATKDSKVIGAWLKRPEQRDNLTAWKAFEHILPQGSGAALRAAARSAVIEKRLGMG